VKKHFSLRARWPWAVAAGIMLAIAQPKFEIAGFAWVAPTILLLGTFGATPKQAFKIGYVGGLVQQLITVYWLLNIPFPAGAIAAWILVSLYLAIYPAFWCMLAWRFFPLPISGPLFDPIPTDRFTETSAAQRLIWGLICGALWVTMEMIQARLIGGFPWNLLGTSQFRLLPLIQISSVTSIYGVSFVMVWFACSSFSVALILTRQRRRFWIAELVPVLVVILALLLFGLAQIRRVQKPTRTVRVALIQPSIPQTLIFDPNENTNRFNDLVRLSEMALKTNPQILIWPEAAVPTMIRWDTNTSDAVINLVTNHHVWAIIGSDDMVPRNRFNPEAEPVDYYNSAFVLSPDGIITGGYRKRLLVIFGEFVPFVETLKFMKYLSPIGDSSFARGEGPAPFHLPDLGVTTSALICFEDTFPQFVRDYVQEDTDFLLNLTNNGWFGESAAQWQHAVAALFRAVENRIPLVRCTNNGLTCWIDEVGRMHEVLPHDAQDVYGRGFKTAEIPLLAEGAKRELTFYTRHGDVFGWGCVGIAALSLGRTARRSRSSPT
jgi:apolipoprotein N-acyltransferase